MSRCRAARRSGQVGEGALRGYGTTSTEFVWICDLGICDVDARDLLAHLSLDETISEARIDDASGIDPLTLSFVAVVDTVSLDDRALAI